MRSKFRVLAGGVVAATAASAAIAAPAHAGFDNDSNWGDEVQLRNGGTVHSGNVVGMWQEILSAEFGLNEGNVDGSFGSNTANYTAVYQAVYGVTADGIVGSQTWNVARFVAGTTISSTPCTGCYYDYGGQSKLSLYWNSGSGGTWKWSGICRGHASNAPNDYVATDYPVASFNDVC